MRDYEIYNKRFNVATACARLAGILLLLSSLLACASQHVRFTREGGNPPFAGGEHSYPGDGFQDKDNPDILRIAFDRNGDLYPDPSKTPIDDARLELSNHSIRAYFETIGQPYDPVEIAREFAGRIEEACEGGKTLVVLVHGINNIYPGARRSYELARMRIRKQPEGREVVFLEVYWDSLHGNPLSSWGPAREISKWVGLGLRGILRQLPDTIPLRALTHSRGARTDQSRDNTRHRWASTRAGSRRCARPHPNPSARRRPSLRSEDLE